MNQQRPQSVHEDLALADAIDQFTELLNEGRQPDIDEFVACYVNGGPSLRPVLETLMAMRQDKVSDASPPSDLIASKLGTLGDFQLLGELGRGGMGIVYEARQISLDRRVAVKVLPFAALLDNRQLQRFRNESRAAAMLKHPNIISVFSVGYERSVHFYAMELIEGQSLAEVIACLKTPSAATTEGARASERDASQQESSTFATETSPIAALSTQRSQDGRFFYRGVARLGIQAASALHHAHQEGVLHRDVKPSNLMLDHSGKLCVTDFGLARIQTGDEMTMTGDLLGTLRYMSPEHLEGRPVDARADVYGLGISLYELVTGKPPFQSRHRGQLTTEILHQTPAPPSTIVRSIPRDLETIILKAIAKSPNDRYDTAGDFSADLERFLENRVIKARRTTRTERAQRWAARNRMTAALAAAVSALLILVSIGSSLLAWKSMAESKRQQLAIYAHEIQLANQAVGQGQFGTAERLLLNWVPQREHDVDHRCFEWFNLWQRSHDPAIERTLAYKLPVYDLEFVEDSSRLAVAGWSNHVDVWNLDKTPVANPEQRSPSVAFGVRCLDGIHRQDKLVLGDVAGVVTTWDLTKNQAVETPFSVEETSDGRELCSMAISDDDRFCAVAATRGGLHVWDQLSKEWVARLDGYREWPSIVFGPLGELIVVSTSSSKLEVFRRSESNNDDDHGAPFVLSNSVQHQLDCDGVRALSLSPDKKTLALGAYWKYGSARIGVIEIWDASQWTQVKRIPLGSHGIQCVEFFPDGTALAVGVTNGDLIILDTSDWSTIVKKKAHSGAINDITISQDLSRLATAGHDAKARIWRLPSLLRSTGGAVRIPEQLTGVHGVGFLEDGQTIALTDRSGQLLICDGAGTIQQRFEIDAGGADFFQLALSNDKKLAAVTCGHFPVQPDQKAAVQIFDLEDSSRQDKCPLPYGLLYSISSFSPDNRLFAAGCLRHVVVIDVDANTKEHELEFKHNVKGLAFSPDGQWLACAETNGVTHFYDATTFEQLDRVETDVLYTGCISFSPDSQRFATVGFDKRIKLFQTNTRQLLREFTQCETYLTLVKFSPDGQRLVTAASDGKVRIWHVATEEELMYFDVPQVWYPQCDFSPDSRSLVVGCGPNVWIFRGANEEILRPMTVHELQDIACQNVTEKSGF